MQILTSQDYQLVASCCGCSFPECAAPRQECQSIGATAAVAWEIAIFNETTSKYDYYTTYKIDYSDGGHTYRSYDQGYSVWLDGWPTVEAAGISIATETVDQTDPRTGTVTTTQEGLVDIAGVQQAALADVVGSIDWDNEDLSFGNSCNSSVQLTDPYAAVVDTLLVATFTRYRIGIPEGYERSYYVVQWDEGFFPAEWSEWNANYQAWLVTYNAYLAEKAAWDACMAAEGGSVEICGEEPIEPDPFPDPEPSPKPSLIASREFTYGGSSEFSPWYEMPIPTENGENRIVNIMVKCYKYSGHGVKPTSIGEVYNFDA